MPLQIPILDIQTSGGVHESDAIVELAWTFIPCQEAFTLGDLNIHSVLHRFADEPTLSSRITALTGIRSVDLLGGESSVVLADRIAELLREVPFWMTHYASFESRFLLQHMRSYKSERAEAIAQIPAICTHQLARRLLPRLPSRSLRALAGFLGAPMPELKRAADHVRGTAVIWWHLRDHLRQVLGPEFTWADVLSYAQQPMAPTSRREKIYILPKEIRLGLEDKPGVYMFRNIEDKIIYIGKATSLKSRVNSYFRGHKGRDAKKLEMLTQTFSLTTESLQSPLEAALREEQLIKQYQPAYNIAQRGHDGAVVLLGRDLQITTETPWLVLPSERWRERLEALLGVFHAQQWSQGVFHCVTDSEALRHLIAELGQAEARDARSLVSWGLKLWRQHQRERAAAAEIVAEERLDAEDETPNPFVTGEPIKDPALIYSVLMTNLRDLGRAYWRYRWVMRLANSALQYRPGQAKHMRRLVFHGGRWQVAEDVEAKNRAPEGLHSDQLANRHSFAMMGILLTELVRGSNRKWRKGFSLRILGGKVVQDYDLNLFKILSQRK